MLCAKCHRDEATIHFTIVAGTEDETIDLCNDCAPARVQDLDLEKVKALSVIGKKCEFCGKEAFSGQMGASSGAIYWCFDCGLELGRILTGKPGDAEKRLRAFIGKFEARYQVRCGLRSPKDAFAKVARWKQNGYHR